MRAVEDILQARRPRYVLSEERAVNISILGIPITAGRKRLISVYCGQKEPPVAVRTSAEATCFVGGGKENPLTS